MVDRQQVTKSSPIRRKRLNRSPDQEQPGAAGIQQAIQQPQQMSPGTMLHLQRTIGNQAVNRILRQSEKIVQRESHDKGCGCPECRQIQAKREVIQRDTVKERAKKFEEESVSSDFEPATLRNADKMGKLAKKIGVAEFVTLAKSKTISAGPIMIALIKYWTPLALTDLETLINEATADEKKTIWSDDTLLTSAEAKLGKDPYLTFATRIGMHRPPTTDELGEGGKEHTPAPKADERIRDKLSAYVTDAVKKGRKIEGSVAVVAGADWDRAGVAHYGNDVWNNGSNPKKDAINGFVDSKGRVWIERNSGNSGTLVHEGIHKYADDAMLNTLGFDVNEGTTEVFTRIAIADMGVARSNYSNQHDIMNSLATAVTKEVVAAAYFDGKLAELKTAFIKYRKDSKGNSEAEGGQIWDKFVAKMEAEEWSKAQKCISNTLNASQISAL
jgi:hypothetical protein